MMIILELRRKRICNEGQPLQFKNPVVCLEEEDRRNPGVVITIFLIAIYVYLIGLF